MYEEESEEQEEIEIAKDVDLGLRADTITPEQIERLLRAGNDNVHGSLRVKRDGTVFLSQTALGNEKLEDIAFYFETFAAHYGEMGPDFEAGDMPKRISNKISEIWAECKAYPGRKLEYVDYY